MLKYNVRECLKKTFKWKATLTVKWKEVSNGYDDDDDNGDDDYDL